MTYLLRPLGGYQDARLGADPFVDADMTEYPTPHYSKKDVVRAGKALKERIAYNEDDSDDAVRIFKIAYDWRDSHAYPMRRIRQEMAGRLRKLRVPAITAGRTKRMKSIRKKLARTTGTLAQMQDLAGCRAILESMEGVNTLVCAYRDGTSVHNIKTDTDYINEPRSGGYRSHHLVLEYQSTHEDEAYEGRRVELQIRTRLQHAWATAVEAVGLTRREDLKAGEGHQQWLRLFALMSSEFSEAEGTAPLVGMEDRKARHEEIRAINSIMKAAETLGHLAHAFRATESIINPSSKYFMIQYDFANETVRVTGYSTPMVGFNKYSAIGATPEAIDSVLVEVDKVESLREAYPNYFGDVRLFTSHLNTIVGRRDHSTWLPQYLKS